MRRGEGLVGWGEAARLEVSGPARPGRGRRLVGGLHRRPRRRRRPRRPRVRARSLFASIAFDPAAGTSVFVVPEVVVGRRDGVGWVTTVGDVDPRDAAPCPPPADDDGRRPGCATPTARSTRPRWCAAVATAVERIDAGELAKVVLARDLLVSADVPLDPRRLLRRLAARFPDCWTFAVDGLLGATPELLLRRTGRQLSARVLAGTAPRGAGRRRRAAGRRADRLGQGPRRARARGRLAGPRAGARTAAASTAPGRARAAHAGQRAAPGHRRHRHPAAHAAPRGRAGLLELVGAVHPTAAVCGTPTADAAALIAELEGMDRGRYAGPVGWLDARGDGEFGLALRCAELAGDDGARLFAGCGIVAGSDPAAELAETQSKFAAFQAALEG